MGKTKTATIKLPPRLERLSDYVGWHAQQQPATEAAVCGSQRYSYAALQAEVDRYARALMATGVQPGDRVATLSPPNPDFLVLFLASCSIGAIWLGLNPRYQLQEIAFLVEDAQPGLLFARCCIGSRDFESTLRELRAECPSLQETILLDKEPCPDDFRGIDAFLERGNQVTRAELEHRRGQVQSGDAALIVYTSGSTGRPKGAVISHHALITCCLTQLQAWPADPIRMLNFLPINHIGCVGDISCYILLGGGTNVFLEQFDAKASLALMERERITVWGGVPTSFQMCLDVADFEAFDLSAIQSIFWSGAAASKDLITRLSRVSQRLSTSYGLTETVGSVTFSEVGCDVPLLAETIGKPAPGYELRLVDARHRTVPQGEPGEIQVRGDFIMKEYWNRPAETAEAIDPEGWLSTGDLAVQRPDGNLKLVGRLKEMFKSGGYNVYPREIEQLLESHPAVTMAAVVSVADELFQEVGWAFVCVAPGAETTVSELEAWCRARLANYKVPKELFIRESLPTLPIGKIDKKALSRWAAAY